MDTKIILPTYTCKLPSTGKTTKFRPFTVKEEKSLLLALQENDIYTIAEALKNTIRICTYETVDPDVTPYYDIEYLFLQIRAKSVGELIEFSGSCDCSPTAKTIFEVDIMKTEVDPKPSGNLKIKIVDTQYSLELRHPSLSEYVEAYANKDSAGTDTVARCIVNVYNDEEVFNWSDAEKLVFVESMTSKQQREIAEFLKHMPTIKLDSTYKCNQCGKVHEKTLSGFENFFV